MHEGNQGPKCFRQVWTCTGMNLLSSRLHETGTKCLVPGFGTEWSLLSNKFITDPTAYKFEISGPSLRSVVTFKWERYELTPVREFLDSAQQPRRSQTSLSLMSGRSRLKAKKEIHRGRYELMPPVWVGPTHSVVHCFANLSGAPKDRMYTLSESTRLSTWL